MDNVNQTDAPSEEWETTTTSPDSKTIPIESKPIDEQILLKMKLNRIENEFFEIKQNVRILLKLLKDTDEIKKSLKNLEDKIKKLDDKVKK